MYDYRPPRFQLFRSPGNRCPFCNKNVIVNPAGKNWAWAEWEGRRMWAVVCHKVCPQDEPPSTGGKV